MNTDMKTTGASSVVLDLELQAAHPMPALAPQVPMVATPLAILERAYQSGADITVLTQLLDLKVKWEADEARKAFVKAMTIFKQNPPKIMKDKLVDYPSKGGRTTYYHATLASVVSAAIQSLAAVGISHSWSTEQGNGTIAVVCTLTHELGHRESVRMEAGSDTSGGKNSIQAVASTTTYLQRYTLLAITGLATEDQDDDGGGHKDPVPDWGDTYLEAVNAAKDAAELKAAWQVASGACRRKGADGRPVYDEIKHRVEERLRDEFGQTGAGEAAK